MCVTYITKELNARVHCLSVFLLKLSQSGSQSGAWGYIEVRDCFACLFILLQLWKSQPTFHNFIICIN